MDNKYDFYQSILNIRQVDAKKTIERIVQEEKQKLVGQIWLVFVRLLPVKSGQG